METFRNKSFFWAFIILWGGLILWNALTPAREFSESENRFLKMFPDFTVKALLSGKFMEDVNVYLNDQFAGRPHWVSMQSMIEYGTGKREINGVYIGKDGILLGDIAKPDMGITAKNIRGIVSFAERYGMPAYVALIPSSTEIKKGYLPRFAEGWDEKSYIAEAYAELEAIATPIDIYGALYAHKDEYVYYGTDHHWTSFGARLSYSSAIAPAMGTSGMGHAEPENVEFLGTYHSKTGFPAARADVMDITPVYASLVRSVEIFDGRDTTVRDSYYAGEFLGKKDKYSYFGGQVHPIVTINTESDSDRKLIIFKDSYAHCLVPMMFGDFSEIRMVDLRFANPLTISEQLEAGKYDEALFLYSTDVFSHQLGAAMLSPVVE